MLKHFREIKMITFKIYKKPGALIPHIYGFNELPENKTIMHALKHIKYNLDKDLVIPNCSEYCCGNCFMKINNQMCFACSTRISNTNVIEPIQPPPFESMLELPILNRIFIKKDEEALFAASADESEVAI
ncbi:MAG: hypothetical protein CML47_06735 [Rhodobacteraceae bacterium]|nr:MAG: hypothetical protein CML47_06735 [Paracoccaceae bacterium]|tara:strand:+ start:245 stop:634 length:390 start_codon:yes stop_codon:yes gene_type:complete